MSLFVCPSLYGSILVCLFSVCVFIGLSRRFSICLPLFLWLYLSPPLSVSVLLCLYRSVSLRLYLRLSLFLFLYLHLFPSVHLNLFLCVHLSLSFLPALPSSSLSLSQQLYPWWYFFEFIERGRLQRRSQTVKSPYISRNARPAASLGAGEPRCGNKQRPSKAGDEK